MFVTNGQLQLSSKALMDLRDKEMPFELSCKVMRVIKLVEPLLFNLSNMRDEAIDKFGQRDEEGNLVFSQDKDGAMVIEIVDKDGLNRSFSPFLSQKNELDLEKIHISEFTGLVISPSTILTLDWLIDDGIPVSILESSDSSTE